MKEAYYFSHDSNSRNDGKILFMRMKHGMRGYGIFWSIVEMLRNESGYKMRLQCERIAFELHEDSELIASVINDFDLFVVKDGFFWSESLLRRMKMKEKKSDKARESALKRWNKDNESERNANALPTQSESNASKVKESKGNINKAFAADANLDLKGYSIYLYDRIKEREASRNTLFMQCKINLERRNEIWDAFINNSIQNIPLIEDEKHAWNAFKKFIIDNQKDYRKDGKSNFTGF